MEREEIDYSDVALSFYGFDKLDEAIKNLEFLRNNECVLLYATPMGNVKFYSNDTVDVCYQKATGLTKKEFDEKCNEITEKAISGELGITHEDAKELPAGDRKLDEIISLLKSLKFKNENVYINYYPVDLYSMFDDEDTIYHKVHQCSKQEWQEHCRKTEEEEKRRLEEQRKQNEIKRQNFIERGRLILPEEKMEDWTNIVNADLRNCDGLCIEKALPIMELLAMAYDDVMKKAIKQFYSYDYSGEEGNVEYLIKEFSERGQDMFDYIDKKRKQELCVSEEVAEKTND